MQTATIYDIKKELNTLEPSRLVSLCLRLASYKKDNKELLTYLLFESENEARYISGIKNEIDSQLETVNETHVYFVKKKLRKTLRYLDKCIRYSKNKETETELRIYFCQRINELNLPIGRSKVLTNLYQGQIKKIKSAMSKLHEDLQYDYGRQLEMTGLSKNPDKT